jgi:lipopolysaccharide/colanic/teichoic acid biosynthesis glycosyltransferase
MRFTEFLGGVGLFARHRGDTALRSLLSEQEFRRLLERERARSDRTGERFSLLTFEAREEGTRLATFRRLAVILRHRVRSTDDLGWLDERRMAALLPCTPPCGAWKLADDVCLRFSLNDMPPLCTVYAYPDERSTRVDSAEDSRPTRTAKPVTPMQPLFAQAVPLWKRAIDVTGALFGLLLFAPLLALIALAVKLDSTGPVLFRQLRTGRGGRPFHICKFRSMTVDAERQQRELLGENQQDGPAFKMQSDPRVTRLGRFLRATSLDELPQLWNVLRGDMSLVGPRPLPCHEADACEVWQQRRLDVSPGVTGRWQVQGRCRVTFDEWMRMDLRYIHDQSLLEDLRLIAGTVPAVILRKGAH